MGKFVFFMTLVTLAFVTGDCQIARAGQPGEDSVKEKTVLDRIGRFDAAWNRGDAEAVTALFSSDGEFVSPSGAVTSTQPEIKKLLTDEFQETFQGTTLTTSVDTVRSVKENVALAKGTYKLSGVDLFLGLAHQRRARFIFRVRKLDRRWMIESAYILRS